MLRVIPLLLTLVLSFTSAPAAVTIATTRCEGLVNPHGVDIAQPRLAWLLHSADRGEKQTAYHVPYRV
jgi:hypothetical protein